MEKLFWSIAYPRSVVFNEGVECSEKSKGPEVGKLEVPVLGLGKARQFPEPWLPCSSARSEGDELSRLLAF